LQNHVNKDCLINWIRLKNIYAKNCKKMYNKKYLYVQVGPKKSGWPEEKWQPQTIN